MITAVLIRHADRDPVSADPPLNAKGIERAEELIHVLGRAGIRRIYRTHFLRSKQTAAPLAEHLGVQPVVMDDVDAVVADIAAQPAGRKVLVVGHTDTVPEIANRLTGKTIPPMHDSEFDNLYVCTVVTLPQGPGSSGVGEVMHLKYGART
jgi:broad specificity phosphatase PhoE